MLPTRPQWEIPSRENAALRVADACTIHLHGWLRALFACEENMFGVVTEVVV